MDDGGVSVGGAFGVGVGRVVVGMPSRNGGSMEECRSDDMSFMGCSVSDGWVSSKTCHSPPVDVVALPVPDLYSTERCELRKSATRLPSGRVEARWKSPW